MLSSNFYILLTIRAAAGRPQRRKRHRNKREASEAECRAKHRQRESPSGVSTATSEARPEHNPATLPNARRAAATIARPNSTPNSVFCVRPRGASGVAGGRGWAGLNERGRDYAAIQRAARSQLCAMGGLRRWAHSANGQGPAAGTRKHARGRARPTRRGRGPAGAHTKDRNAKVLGGGWGVMAVG